MEYLCTDVSNTDGGMEFGRMRDQTDHHSDVQSYICTDTPKSGLRAMRSHSVRDEPRPEAGFVTHLLRSEWAHKNWDRRSLVHNLRSQSATCAMHAVQLHVNLNDILQARGCGHSVLAQPIMPG